MQFIVSSFAVKFIDYLSSNCYNVKTFSTSAILCRIGAWRIKHNLPAKGKEYGPLTDLPDWSYADGRPAPLGENMKKRIKLHASYCEQIIKLNKEVDECFELIKQKSEMGERMKQQVILNRLKSKGKLVI